MKKLPSSGDNFRLVGEVAGKVVRDLEKEVDTIKNRGKKNGKSSKQSKR